MALQHVAEEYFSQLNSITRRMYEDMKETRQAYEDLWKTISEKEQKQILSESIISPEIMLKYNQEEQETNATEYSVKVIIDEHCSYTDEHSGPFSFKTKSQRDLCLFEKEVEPEKKIAIKTRPKKSAEVILNGDTCEHAHETNSNCSTLPKTGLDFLDNW